MSIDNPYTTPEAIVDTANDEKYQPKIFSVAGRIGRLRYLAYSTATNLLLMLLMILLSGGTAFIEGGQDQAAGLLGVLFYVATVAFAVIFTVRRLNDLDRSGWFCLLWFVPFINLLFAIYLIFFAGSTATNRYGPAPVENPLWVKILGLLLPIIMIVGILAAITIPAYQAYLEEARMMQGQ
ncbi:MAG: DUF805 domain-containing protein [Candidatus Sedimenticola sp. PURPLELP]